MTILTRAGLIRSLWLAPAAALLAAGRARAQASKSHRMVFHVDRNEAEVMTLALNNARNLIDYYRPKNEDVAIDIVAYGPGLHMLRDDTSPVKDRIKDLAGNSFPSQIAFSACDNTKRAMEKREGRTIALVPQATLVPAGVVHILERQEAGYAYLKP